MVAATVAMMMNISLPRIEKLRREWITA